MQELLNWYNVTIAIIIAILITTIIVLSKKNKEADADYWKLLFDNIDLKKRNELLERYHLGGLNDRLVVYVKRHGKAGVANTADGKENKNLDLPGFCIRFPFRKEFETKGGKILCDIGGISYHGVYDSVNIQAKGYKGVHPGLQIFHETPGDMMDIVPGEDPVLLESILKYIEENFVSHEENERKA